MDDNYEIDHNNEEQSPQNDENKNFSSDDKQDELKNEAEPIKDFPKSQSILGSKEGEDKAKQQIVEDQDKINPQETAVGELEQKFVEKPPPDPAAPYDLTDSSEALKPPFGLRPDQLAELEDLWDIYQDYTPAYTDINGYITEKELAYMLKSLFLMPYTPEQLQELIAFCVRPPHPEGHISFDEFVKIATIRYRDLSIEENLRSALRVLDVGEGLMNRDNMKEILTTMGHKMSAKQINLLIKEVDIRNDGLIGIEDVMATICIDLIFE